MMPRAGSVGDSGYAVERVWETYAVTLRRAVQRMTDDPDEQKDLLQEALVELWLTDPTRFDLRDRGERRYLRRVMVNRMWRVWRAERAFERAHHSP